MRVSSQLWVKPMAVRWASMLGCLLAWELESRWWQTTLDDLLGGLLGERWLGLLSGTALGLVLGPTMESELEASVEYWWARLWAALKEKPWECRLVVPLRWDFLWEVMSVQVHMLASEWVGKEEVAAHKGCMSTCMNNRTCIAQASGPANAP